MNDQNWCEAKSPAQTSPGFVQSLFSHLFRPAAPGKAPAPVASGLLSRIADCGADASWTASLHRGNDLPPFLLCVEMTAGSGSAVRFGPFDRRIAADALGRDL